ncbi:MAG TPA: hypothetical protein VGE01_03985 [Fimbriimonas sp.]
MAKISKPVLYTMILAAGALIWVFATEPDPAPKRPARKAVANTTRKVTETYLPEDYELRFASVNEAAKNAFRPLVVRRNTAMVASPPDPDRIPLEAIGEPDWIYTGIVEVNGTTMALVENDSTGEGVYLRRGDRWKKVVVSSISDEALMLTGPGGTPYRIKLGEREGAGAAEAPTPVSPPLQGVIGATPGVPALPGVVRSNDLSVQPEQAIEGRRPRRRDRQW